MNTFFNNIKISNRDLEEYTCIGNGRDGKVYRLTHNRCVKIFFQEETQQKELEALIVGQTSPIIPRLYEYGENYIVMEYICGISLAQYLKKEKWISEELTRKILIMLDELKQIGFTRWDTEIRHVLINVEGELKVIDHKRAFTLNRKVPIKLLQGLEKLGLLHVFLNHVKNIHYSTYRTWKEYEL